MTKNKFPFYLRGRRLFDYLRYLQVFYLKKTAIPFLYTSTGYLLYAFLNGAMGWNFPNYSMTHTVVNFILIIVFIQTTSMTFASLYQTHTTLQEYSIPVSMEERFLGSFLFYGGVMLGLTYIIHTLGYGIMLGLGAENSDEYISHLWGDYKGFNLGDMALVYLYFFAGSCYFRKSPIAKSLLLLVIAMIISEVLFSYFNLSEFMESRNSQDNSLSNPNLSFTYISENQNFIQTLTHYLLLGAWFLGGYFKLRNSQFRT